MTAVTRREFAGGAAASTLSGAINSSVLTINGTDLTGWPTGATGPFYIVIDRGEAGEEKVLCDSRAGNVLTVNASGRGADGTSAASHDAGAVVEHVWTATDADDVNRVAAALTTKGDLLGFGSSPVRVPVGADDTILVADSSDAEGVAWKVHDGGTQVAHKTSDQTHPVGGFNADTAIKFTVADTDAWLFWGVLFMVVAGGSDAEVDIKFTVPGTSDIFWGIHAPKPGTAFSPLDTTNFTIWGTDRTGSGPGTGAINFQIDTSVIIAVPFWGSVVADAAGDVTLEVDPQSATNGVIVKKHSHLLAMKTA